MSTPYLVDPNTQYIHLQQVIRTNEFLGLRIKEFFLLDKYLKQGLNKWHALLKQQMNHWLTVCNIKMKSLNSFATDRTKKINIGVLLSSNVFLILWYLLVELVLYLKTAQSSLSEPFLNLYILQYSVYSNAWLWHQWPPK